VSWLGRPAEDWLPTLDGEPRPPEHGKRPWIRATCSACHHDHSTKKCRRRQCDEGSVLWARDVRSVVLAAVEAAGVAGVRSFVMTAPGADRLPWDEAACIEEGPHHHTAKIGCRAQRIPVMLWEAAVPGNWKREHEAALKHLWRRGMASPLITWIDEDQARGVLHRNVLLEEGPAARAYHAFMIARASKYGWGFVDRKRNVAVGAQAVAYLTGYVVAKGGGKRERKTDLSAAAGRAARYRRVWATSPRLTKKSGVTMASIRRGRQVWAAKQGFCSMPVKGLACVDWWIIDLATGEVFNRCFRAQKEDPPGAPVQEPGGT